MRFKAPDDGPYTVAKALDVYFAGREGRGSKGLAKEKAAADVRILPELGEVEIGKLTKKRISDWHHGPATAPKLAPAGRSTRNRKTRAVNPKDADAVRARRSTANRTLTVLKAALNHAFLEGRVVRDDAWRRVMSFKNVDAAAVRFLSEDECHRLVNACDCAFRDLIRAALLKGRRYSELTRMRVSHFNAEAGTITVRESKAGKPGHVALTDEGRQLFATPTVRRRGRDPIFLRDDGNPRAASHRQRRSMPRASARRSNRSQPFTTHVTQAARPTRR